MGMLSVVVLGLELELGGLGAVLVASALLVAVPFTFGSDELGGSRSVGSGGRV